ncbi:hypothetical protein PHLGIDRAFT_123144 [Phlebiopsis gigantea 11061_1 CR5-6]|uniref:Uncharacterized protein n=1 Tax=Phlebiopsis gigantea (strain 11061_1 CR5-6) TaxID=745531 RepID=A0A0C3RZ72_PHLG1|nr:hypothetical protein PHLGIDRAFT_123144 [Phlebiopsis gigantea 11061_1 CR5-6]
MSSQPASLLAFRIWTAVMNEGAAMFTMEASCSKLRILAEFMAMLAALHPLAVSAIRNHLSSLVPFTQVDHAQNHVFWRCLAWVERFIASKDNIKGPDDLRPWADELLGMAEDWRAIVGANPAPPQSPPPDWEEFFYLLSSIDRSDHNPDMERDRYAKMAEMARTTEATFRDTIERMEFLRRSIEHAPVFESLERHDRIVQTLQQQRTEWRSVKDALEASLSAIVSRDRQVFTE